MKTFTSDEVKAILSSVYEYYGISSTRKFLEDHFGNSQDEPSSDKIMEAEIEDMESFIF